MQTNLTYKELINYIDLNSTDPMVRRLLEILQDRDESIVEGLVQAGMDPVDHRFDYDGYYYSPGQYIDQLRNDVDFHEREAQEWEEKYQNMKDERDQLRARSVADLLADMRERIRRAEATAGEADREVTRLQRRNADLEEKINVWNVVAN